MFDWKSLSKYAMEGLAVGVASYLIPSKSMTYQGILLVAVTAAAVFAILDQFSPVIAYGSRHGTGFAIGYQQIGLGQPQASQQGDVQALTRETAEHVPEQGNPEPAEVEGSVPTGQPNQLKESRDLKVSRRPTNWELRPPITPLLVS